MTDTDALAAAGHRVDEPHDCFSMNCRGLGHEVEALRAAVRERDELREAAEAVDELWFLGRGVVKFVDPQQDAFVALTRLRTALHREDGP